MASLPAKLDIRLYQGDDYTHTSAIYDDNADIKNRGAWSSVYTYKINDLVKHNSVPYRCILGHLNQEPANATYWSLLSGIDLSAATWSANIKIKRTDSTVIDTFTLSSTAAGQFTFSLTDTQTSAFDFDKAVYEIKYTIAGFTTTILTGNIIMWRDV